jgi:HJR/Mrr/RecB family endonuclease
LPLVQSDWPEGLITATAVDLQIISRILNNPELLDNLEPRAFEVLIANLFQGFGAEVELTQQTRDSGFDVGAVFEIGDAHFRVLIEAKKWRESRKVGIGTVDRLIGVKQRLKADRVVLATTSSFSSIAQTAAAQLHTEIELVDRSGVVKWIERYMLPIEGTAIKLPSINVASKSSL